MYQGWREILAISLRRFRLSSFPQVMATKEYHREYNKNRYYRVRQKILLEMGGKCSICGNTEHLQIDHINGKDKSFNVSAFITYPYEKLLAEVSKCQLLCKECHFDKTLSDRGFKKAIGTHGTISSYRYCKCEICRKAKSISNKKYKKRKLPV